MLISLHQGVGRAVLQACIWRQCRYLRAGTRLPQPGALSKNRVATASIIVFSVGFGVYLVWPSSSRHALTSSTLPLSPYHFTPVTVESSEANPLDSSTKVITIRIPPSHLPESSFLQPVHSVYIKNDDMQVERPYTPLFGIEQDGEAAGRATFWIKRYPQGEVGRWLHSKRVGDILEMRGPVSTWDYVKEMENGNKWDEIIMVWFSLVLSVSPGCS
jgi:cytochrome-b5 reductase